MNMQPVYTHQTSGQVLSQLQQQLFLDTHWALVGVHYDIAVYAGITALLNSTNVWGT